MAYRPSFDALVFQSGLEYRNVDGRINSGDNLNTSCKNLVNFGPVTPGFTRLMTQHTPGVDHQFG